MPESLVKPGFKMLLPGFLRQFLPSALVISLIAYGLASKDMDHHHQLQEAAMVNRVELAVTDIELTFRNIISDLRYLAESNAIHRMAEGDDDAQQELASDLLSFSRQKRFYDQVRFLDSEGMERVRINYNAGRPAIVPEGALQNKKGRYYFEDTLRLSMGEVFVSPLDLNIEQGQVERPFKPMIRFGMPVFDSDGHKRGIVLLNFLAEKLLTRFDRIVVEDVEGLYLLNRDGYWLSSPNPGEEWGFMFPERKELTFGKRFSNAWREMLVNNSGHYEEERGHFQYATVYPITPELRTSSGAGEAFMPSDRQLGSEDYFWKVVAHHPSDSILGAISSPALMVLYALLLLGIGLATWFRSRYLSQMRLTLLQHERNQEELEEQVDVRTRKLSESHEQLNLLLESAGEGLYGIDIEGRCTFANRAALKTLGYQDEDQVLGKNMHELIHHSHADGSHYDVTACHIFKAFRQGEEVYRDDEVLWRADGSAFSAEYRSYPIQRDGAVVGAVVTFNDITERKQTEQALRRSQKMDAIGQLTGGIAHDFNNILGIILGNLDLLERHLITDDKTLKRLVTIQKSAQRAADLTQQLLGFSRQQAAQRAVTDINQLIGGMDNLIARSVTPEVEVGYQLADELWSTEIDPGDFEDALLNLVINAHDVMPGGGRLTLETRNFILDAAYCAQNPGVIPGQYVQLAVSDSGEGIPPEQQEQIFEPFYTSKELGKGTGLGLAMVYGFVKRSGGHITLYSESGIGTTFHIYLPREQGQEQQQPVEVTAEQPGKLPGGNELILAVDDEEGLLELARESLQALGYQVLTASNGKQALARLAKEPAIKLLFSDVVMPGGMNGYELAEQAIAECPELKVLLTSGYTEKAIAHNGQALFNANLLSKPYSQAELAQRVRETLGEPGQAVAQSVASSIEWTDAFSIGIDAIDDDHRILLGLLKRCQQVADGEGDREALEVILTDLMKYTQTHFKREEAVMEACGYPGLANHRQVHQLLIKTVAEKQRYFQQDIMTVQELLLFLNSWLVDHIQVMDHAIAPYCQGKDELIAQTLEQAGPAPGEEEQS